MSGLDLAKHLETYGMTPEEFKKQHHDLNSRIHAQHQAAQEKKKNKKQKTPKPSVPKERTIGALL